MLDESGRGSHTYSREGFPGQVTSERRLGRGGAGQVQGRGDSLQRGQQQSAGKAWVAEQSLECVEGETGRDEGQRGSGQAPGSSLHATLRNSWKQTSMLMCVPAKSLQSCQTPCDRMDCSPTVSSVHGVLQTRRLDWVAISSPRGTFLIQVLNSGLLHCRQVLYHWATWEVFVCISPTLFQKGFKAAVAQNFGLYYQRNWV